MNFMYQNSEKTGRAKARTGNPKFYMDWNRRISGPSYTSVLYGINQVVTKIYQFV